MQFPRRFRYCLDPICVGSVILYAVNRWYLRPHHIGGLFTIGYLNDVICLPLFLPVILGVQRLLRVRLHDGYPRLWEMLQNWVIFSVLFEGLIPHFPRYFRSTADPLAVLAYLAGGLAAWIGWTWRARRVARRASRKSFGPSSRFESSPAVAGFSPASLR